MNATAIAAALGARAEEVCRRYLPHGRRQGRYWVAGDLDGARGRSLFVRLAGPGTPGKFTDAATGEHGDLLDIIRHRAGAPTLRAALDEARAFLALPAAPAAGEGDAYDAGRSGMRRLWRRCRAIDGTHAEAYLRARGLARCRLHASVFAALRFHPALRYREGGVRAPPAGAGRRRHRRRRGTPWSGGTPRSRLHLRRTSDLARSLARLPRRASRRPARRSAACMASPSASANQPPTHWWSARASRRCCRSSLRCRTPSPPPRCLPAASARSRRLPASGASSSRATTTLKGERAAERLVRRCAGAGVSAQVIVPQGGDFNDDLVAFGAHALAARLAPLIAPTLPAPTHAVETAECRPSLAREAEWSACGSNGVAGQRERRRRGQPGRSTSMGRYCTDLKLRARRAG